MFGDQFCYFHWTPSLPNPHWLKALSRGRAWKHAPGFSSFDWRKRRVWPTDMCMPHVGGFSERTIKPETRPSIIDWLCQSGIPETQGARGFHRLHHEQMIDSEQTDFSVQKTTFPRMTCPAVRATGQLSRYRFCYLSATLSFSITRDTTCSHCKQWIN